MGCLALCISAWNDPVEKVFLVALLLVVVVVVVVIFPWFLIHICCDDLFLSRFVQFLEEGDTSLISPCVLYWQSHDDGPRFYGD